MDNGSVSTVGNPAALTANQPATASQFLIGGGGAFGAFNTNASGGTVDTWMTRGSATGVWNFGKTLGASDGSIKAATGTFGTAVTVVGKNICLADGTNCPAAAPADAGTLTGITLNSTVLNSSLTSVGTLDHLDVTNAVSAGSITAGNGFTGTKTAGSCVFTIVSGIITNVGGC